MGSKKKNRFGCNVQLSAKDTASQTARMSVQSPCRYIDGETFLVLFSVSFWTRSSLLKPVRNYHNSLSQRVIIFAKRFVVREGFPISPRFRGRRKGRRLLILLRGPQQYKQRNKLISGNRKLIFKSISFLRQTSEPQVVILNTCCLGSNSMLLS